MPRSNATAAGACDGCPAGEPAGRRVCVRARGGRTAGCWPPPRLSASHPSSRLAGCSRRPPCLHACPPWPRRQASRSSRCWLPLVQTGWLLIPSTPACLAAPARRHPGAQAAGRPRAGQGAGERGRDHGRRHPARLRQGAAAQVRARVRQSDLCFGFFLGCKRRGAVLPDAAKERPLRRAPGCGLRGVVAPARTRGPQLRALAARGGARAVAQAPGRPLTISAPPSRRRHRRSGTVVRVGPGKQDGEGGRKAPKVKEGDRVIYFKCVRCRGAGWWVRVPWRRALDGPRWCEPPQSCQGLGLVGVRDQLLPRRPPATPQVRGRQHGDALGREVQRAARAGHPGQALERSQ